MIRLTIKLDNDSELQVSLSESETISILLSLKKRARFNKELNDVTTQFIKNNFDEEMRILEFSKEKVN
jgi:hypothetical protein